MSQNKMPVIFISHGSPTLAVDTSAGEDFKRWGAALPKPKAILIFSAHWLAAPLAFGETGNHQDLIYDFSGFPDDLYELQYPAPGAPQLVEEIQSLLIEPVSATQRGLDHGVWVPLLHMWPSADVPVLQMSLPHKLSDDVLFQLGHRLAPLRASGVLIVGSGGLTHNLREAFAARHNQTPDWVRQFDDWAAQTLLQDKSKLLNWESAPYALQNHPTPEHFRPLLVAAGAADPEDAVTFPVSGFEWSVISRRAVQFG